MLRVLDVFFAEPSRPHYLAGISRRIRLSHTSVKRNLIRLVRLGLISEQKEQRGSRKFPVFKAAADSKEFRMYKIQHNLLALLESGLVGFVEDRLAPKSIVLFGSYRWGEDDETSDVDLFVECGKEVLDLGRFEARLGRKVQLHFAEKFAAYPKELRNNIINGIVISGFLEGYV